MGQREVLAEEDKLSVRYAAWLRAAGLLAGPADDGSVLLIAQPSPDIPERVDAARRAGVTRIISAVLPDEFDGPARAWWDRRIESFAAHFEFSPQRLLAAVPAGAPATRTVLCLTERHVFPGVVEEVARAYAEAWHSTYAGMSVGEATPAVLATAIAGVSTVVNDVDDWLLAFAIDEYAARCGVRVVHLRGTGCSPLRHALLGQIPPPITRDVPRLRQQLTSATALDGPPAPPADAWFDGSASAHVRWRRLYHPRDVRAYWAGVDWAAVAPGPFDQPGNWLNRPATWAALAVAAGDSGAYPRDAASRVVTAMTQRLVAEQRRGPGGWVRERGLARWVVRQPAWIDLYRKNGGDGRDGREALGRWLARGFTLAPAGMRLFAAFSAARWALDQAPDEPGVFALVRAWAERWEAVRVAAAAVAEPSPDVRAACAEAAWEHLHASAPSALASADLCNDPAPWNHALGGAAPLFRACAAARAGQRAAARAAWREMLAAAGLSARGGLARLARVALAPPAEALPLLTRAARTPASALAPHVPEVVLRWFQARKWSLWRLPRAAGDERELTIALRLLEESRHTAASAWSITHGRVLITLQALAGWPGAVGATATEWAARDPRVAEAVVGAAVALALRGHANPAMQLVAAWPETADEKAMGLFLRAIVAQAAGQRAACDALLGRLRAAAPGFLRDTTAVDSRWAFAAAVMARAGDAPAAARLREVSARVAAGSEAFIDDAGQAATGELLAAGWKELTAP